MIDVNHAAIVARWREMTAAERARVEPQLALLLDAADRKLPRFISID